jgi:anaerobic selenocysteine-containing dehydrogenase
MHILSRDGLVDRHHIAAHTLGFDRLETEVLPGFPPARVAAITGLAEAAVEGFAAQYGAAERSFIRLGEGMTRLARGGEALRAVALLPGVTGAYGRTGGGALLLTAASCELDYAALRRPSGPAATRTVNHLRLGDDLLNLKDPPIRALFIAANNPAVTCPEANKVRAGLLRDDLFTVVHDPFLTATARYADIVLPATTYLETEDLYRSYGSYFLQYADAVFHDTAEGVMGRLLNGAATAAGPLDPAAVRAGKPVGIAPSGGQTFATPSGRLEFYSEQMIALDQPAMPDWRPDPEEERDAARWPLRLLTTPGYFQAHTAYAGVAFLRRREGEPYCVLHPEEAARRGLSDGAKVRLYNDRAAIGLVLRVNDEVQPGVVLVPGQRPDAETLHGTVNMLCSDRYTDIGEGATYQSTFLDVAAWDAAQPG